jgi:hypothetical protein
MTRNPVPGLVMPSPHNTERQSENNHAVRNWSKSVSPRMLAVDTPLYAPTAAPTPPSDAYLMQGGYQTVAFTAGAGTLTLPKGFPNGVLSFSGNSFSNIIIGLDGFPSLTTIPLYAYQSFVTGYTGNVDVSYHVVGW